MHKLSVLGDNEPKGSLELGFGDLGGWQGACRAAAIIVADGQAVVICAWPAGEAVRAGWAAASAGTEDGAGADGLLWRAIGCQAVEAEAVRACSAAEVMASMPPAHSSLHSAMPSHLCPIMRRCGCWLHAPLMQHAL